MRLRPEQLEQHPELGQGQVLRLVDDETVELHPLRQALAGEQARGGRGGRQLGEYLHAGALGTFSHNHRSVFAVPAPMPCSLPRCRRYASGRSAASFAPSSLSSARPVPPSHSAPRRRLPRSSVEAPGPRAESPQDAVEAPAT